MSSYEDRIAALEQKVTDIELERLYERRKAAESTPSEQAYDAKQVNYRLTMLLGIASGQEHDIKTIKNDLGSVKEDVSVIKDRLASLETKSDEHTSRLSRLETKSDEHTSRLSRVETTLMEHTGRFDRLETMLGQILARLPEKP